MALVDPHSFTESTQPATTYTALTLYFDFSSSTIHAYALFTLQTPHSGPFVLDTRSLTIHSALHANKTIPFSLSTTSDPIKGTLLTLTLSNHSSFILTFSTSPSYSALQWLFPPQTRNKTHPYIYTQCQAIHARSIFPSHDTPARRICYSSILNIPSKLSPVMAANHVTRCPLRDDNTVALASLNLNWCSQDRVVEEFVMEQPVPRYLFAFAVGT